MRGYCRACHLTSPSGRFDPRPCMRGDRFGELPTGMASEFRSTPLHEGRPGNGPAGRTPCGFDPRPCMRGDRSEEHTSDLQSLMRISYAVFCLKKKIKRKTDTSTYS